MTSSESPPARSMRVTVTSIRPAGDRERDRGLLAYVTVLVNDSLRLDGLTIRISREGRPTVCFPERSDGRGRNHPLVWPVTPEAWRAFESEILSATDIGRFVAPAASRPATQADSGP